MNIPYVSESKNGWISIESIGDFSVFRTFDCGQCFRFDPVFDPDFETTFEGIAHSHHVRFAQKGDGKLYIKASSEDFEKLWLSYLALDTDYEIINQKILASLSGNDALHMEKALNASRGIRILRQEPWEALCSFIISQNNNIPRIKKIISAMCERFGERIDGGYAFPTPKALLDGGENEIFNLKTGFRAKYIYDAAKKVESGELELENVSSLNYADAEKALMTVKGVGPKVAACALLFGFEKLSAFPIDVWMKKVIATRFKNGLDPLAFGDYAGIAQQYLFYFERYIGD